jgi:hypothetical protein
VVEVEVLEVEVLEVEVLDVVFDVVEGAGVVVEVLVLVVVLERVVVVTVLIGPCGAGASRFVGTTSAASVVGV